jgi:hypothetical protein
MQYDKIFFKDMNCILVRIHVLILVRLLQL